MNWTFSSERLGKQVNLFSSVVSKARGVSVQMYDVFHHISCESEVDGQLDVQENVDKLNSDISIDSSTYKLISHLTSD